MHVWRDPVKPRRTWSRHATLFRGLQRDIDQNDSTIHLVLAGRSVLARDRLDHSNARPAVRSCSTRFLSDHIGISIDRSRCCRSTTHVFPNHSSECVCVHEENDSGYSNCIRDRVQVD